jgi:hypothetical protein
VGIVENIDCAGFRAGELGRLGDYCGEDVFKIDRRIYRLADFAQCLQLLDGAGQLVCARTQFVEQSDIFNRDHRLVGEGLSQLDLLVGKGPDFGAGQHHHPDRLALP